MRVEILGYTRHPASAVWPDLILEEYVALRDNIAEQGQLHAILVSPVPGKGKKQRYRVIDGWHRMKACEELGREPIVEVCHWSEAEIAAAVVGLHAGRRHLTKIELARLTVATMEACGMRFAGEGDRRNPEQTGQVGTSAITRETVARDASVSRRTAQRAIVERKRERGLLPLLPARRPDRLVDIRRALDLLQKGEPAKDVADLDDDERAEYRAMGALLRNIGGEMEQAAPDLAAKKPETAPKPVTAASRKAARESRKGWPGPHTLTGETWHAYADAYKARYGVDPIWNATVGGQIAQVVKRIGRLEAPLVAAFYLQREDRWYREKGHPVGSLLNDAENLRTAWKTGQRAGVDSRDPLDAARVARQRRAAREQAAG